MKLELNKKTIISVSVRNLKLVPEFTMSDDMKTKLDMVLNKYPVTKLIKPVLVADHLSEQALTSIIEEFRETVSGSLNLNYFGDEKIVREILKNLTFDVVVSREVVYENVGVAPYTSYSDTVELHPIEEYPSAYLVPEILDVRGALRHNLQKDKVEILHGTVAYSASLMTDEGPVTDKFGVRHYPIELFPKTKQTII